MMELKLELMLVLEKAEMKGSQKVVHLVSWLAEKKVSQLVLNWVDLMDVQLVDWLDSMTADEKVGLKVVRKAEL